MISSARVAFGREATLEGFESFAKECKYIPDNLVDLHRGLLKKRMASETKASEKANSSSSKNANDVSKHIEAALYENPLNTLDSSEAAYWNELEKDL